VETLPGGTSRLKVVNRGHSCFLLLRIFRGSIGFSLNLFDDVPLSYYFICRSVAVAAPGSMLLLFRRQAFSVFFVWMCVDAVSVRIGFFGVSLDSNLLSGRICFISLFSSVRIVDGS
jgi:hypothetical protein